MAQHKQLPVMTDGSHQQVRFAMQKFIMVKLMIPAKQNRMVICQAMMIKMEWCKGC